MMKLCSGHMEMSLDLSLSYCAYRDTSVALVADINLLTRVNFRALKHDPATHTHMHTHGEMSTCFFLQGLLKLLWL